MNSNLIIAYRITVLVLLSVISLQILFLKKDLKIEMAAQLATLRGELNAELKEIDMVISKLDYVESDINSRK